MRAAAGLLLLIATSCGRTAPPAEQIYVSAETGDEVVAIDPATGAVTDRIAAGRRPRGLVLSGDGHTLYVAVSGSPIGGPGVNEATLPPADRRRDGIAVIDLPGRRVSRVLAAGNDPETFALSPDGRTLFVSNEEDGIVSAVETDGGGRRASAKVGDEPEGIAVTRDGARLFVACEASDHVAMLDARTLRLLRTIPLKGRPRGLLLSDDGATVFVSVETGGRLALIDAATGAVRREIDLAQGDPTQRPMGMVERADGRLFVTTGRGGEVLEVDPAAGTVLRRIKGVGTRPWGVALATNGTLVTANGPAGDVTVIDAAKGTILRRVRIGGGPWGVVAAHSGG